MVKNQHLFHTVRRPAGSVSRYPLIVVDENGLPHLPLTQFSHLALQFLAEGTVRTYLQTLLPYFTYLATDGWRSQRGDQWDSNPEAVRESVCDYLVYQLHCKARPHDAYELVFLTGRSPSTVRIFLSALKQFYTIARRTGWYRYAHPLVDSTLLLLQEVVAEERRASGQSPQMPQVSGVEAPRDRFSSENYFRLAGEIWIPQPIDDPHLHQHLVKHFATAKLNLRDQIVVRMAYETGERISELVQLTIGDWRKRGCNQEALTFSKGSRGRRVKVVRFSPETAKMLHRYVNVDRKMLDSGHRCLEQLDDNDSLFLSKKGRPYSYEAFKPHWYALCRAAQIDLNIHGLRHWFTTQSIREIIANATSPEAIIRGKEALVRYMAWRSPGTLEAYEHFFQAADHAHIQDQLFLRLYERDKQYLETVLKPSTPVKPDNNEVKVKQEEQGWETLLALGGGAHA
jgi:integrase